MYQGETGSIVLSPCPGNIPARGDWVEYERLKKQIREAAATSGEYEIKIKELVDRLGI